MVVCCAPPSPVDLVFLSCKSITSSVAVLRQFYLHSKFTATVDNSYGPMDGSKETEIVGQEEENELRQMVERCTGEAFTLDTVTCNGNQANFVAISRASQMRIDKTMFPCGTYTAQDGEWLENKSVIEWSPKSRRAILVSPSCNITHEHHQEDVVVLPYIINIGERYSDTYKKEYELYEKKCLDDLEMRIILSRVKLDRTPFEVLFLELVTAQHGASLSEEAMRRIGRMAQKYRIKIVVDEIMTAGLVGPKMLKVLDAPPEFVAQVEYVIVGKWMGGGEKNGTVPKINPPTRHK